MYAIFNDSYTPITGVIRPPGFELVRRTIIRETDKVLNYYHTRPIPVKSNHILCRVLDVASIPLRYEIDRYMDIAFTRAPYVSKHFNFTSSINYGRQFSGMFYGEGSIEYILTEEHYINVGLAITNWRSIRAVRVLDHPISDLSILLPDGRKASTAVGTSIISINIPLLLLQYRCFMFDRLDNREDDRIYSIAQFVHMFVLPGMLASQTDLAIFNRLADLHYGREHSTPVRKHPFIILQHNAKLDHVLGEVLDKIRDAKHSYPTYLANIPAVRFESAKDALLMPDIARTRQVWWLMLKARMRHMEVLIDIGGAKGIHYNGIYIAKLKTDFKRMRNQHIFEALLPPSDVADTEAFMAKILAL